MDRKKQIIYKNVDELIPYENNPRINTKAVEVVKQSLQEFKFQNPIIIDANNVIVCGHTRLLASKELGLTEVPCIIADDLTEEQIKAFRIADNSSAQVAEWDMQKLMAELETIDYDMSKYGLAEQMAEIETIIEKEKAKELVEDEIETDNIPKRTETGDIWKLGNHYLGCGDSTDFLWLKTLMQGKKADLVFTDPPYGMKKEKDGVANDNLNYDDLLEFNKQWIPLTFDLLKDNGSWYCWGIDEPLMDIYSNILKPLMRENKITFRNFLTWDKGNGQGQMSEKHNSYAVASEKCLFVACGKTVSHINSWQKKFDERFRPLLQYLKQQKKLCGWDTAQLKTIAGCKGLVADHWTTTDQWRVPPEDVYKRWQDWAKENGIKAFLKPHQELVEEQEKIKKEYEKERTYFDNCHDNMNDVWHFDRTSNEEKGLTGGHATPKPIALCGRAIKSSSRENEIVLDVFGGSGSTLIACEQLNRVCYMNELDPHWCDVIINRWEQFTGKKAEKLNRV